MRKKTTSGSKYLRKPMTRSPFLKKGIQGEKAGNQWTVYQSIAELPLYLFIDAIVDDKISSVVKKGIAPAADIQRSWEELLLQYNEALGDSESRLFFSLHKQILQKEIDIRNVECALIMLAAPEKLPESGIKKFQDFLNEILFSDVHLDPDDMDDYQDRLQVWRNMSASIKMARDLKRIQYDAIKEKKKTQGQKPDRTYFQTTLLNLSDYAQYPVTDQISTFEFCERFRRLCKFLDSRPIKK
jgi:hypothetical protein